MTTIRGTNDPRCQVRHVGTAYWGNGSADRVISIEVFTVASFDLPRRPVQFESGGAEWGPSLDGPCPWGPMFLPWSAMPRGQLGVGFSRHIRRC